MPRRCLDFLYAHPVLNFVLMAVYFMLFGFTSVNLFIQLKMNIELFLNYGLVVIEDGALQQLFELSGQALVAITFLVLYKVGEKLLVDRLTEKRQARVAATAATAGTATAPNATRGDRAGAKPV